MFLGKQGNITARHPTVLLLHRTSGDQTRTTESRDVVAISMSPGRAAAASIAESPGSTSTFNSLPER